MVPRNQPEQMNFRSASYTHHRMNPSSRKSAKLTRQDIQAKTSRSSYPRPGPQSPNYRQGYGIPDYAVGFIPPQMSSYIRPSSAINNIYSPRGYGGYPNYRSGGGSDAFYHGGDTSNYRRHFGSDFSPYFQGAVNGSAVALLGFLYLLSQTQVNKYLFLKFRMAFRFRRPSSVLLSTFSKKFGQVGEPEIQMSHRPMEKVNMGRDHWIFPAAGGRTINSLRQPHVRGIEAHHAIGLLGLLLFINLLRVTTSQMLQSKWYCGASSSKFCMLHSIVCTPISSVSRWMILSCPWMFWCNNWW